MRTAAAGSGVGDASWASRGTANARSPAIINKRLKRPMEGLLSAACCFPGSGWPRAWFFYYLSYCQDRQINGPKSLSFSSLALGFAQRLVALPPVVVAPEWTRYSPQH